MMYPFMTLNDNTEIVHSELIDRAGKTSVKVCIEKPIYDGFHSAVCYLPDYSWEDIHGFSEEEISKFQKFLESLAHVIIELAGEGGIEGGFGDARYYC